MKLTKTWLSYIIWGFFSIIFFTNIGIAAIEIQLKNEMSDFLMPILVMYGGAVAGILLLIGLYKVFEKFILPKTNKDDMPSFSRVAEWLTIILVLLVAIVIRVIVVIASGTELEGTTVFYENAISYGTVTFNTYSNGSYIYCGFLGFFLDFFGHFPAAAIGVQSVLQIMTIIASYFMLKKTLGRVAGLVSVLMMSFLPGSFLAVRYCTPDALFVLFFVLYLLALSYLCQANREQKIRGRIHALYYLLIGLSAAFLAYYDIIGLVAFFVGVVALTQSKNEEAWLKIQKPFMQNILFGFSFAFFLFLMLWFLPNGEFTIGPDSLVAYLMSVIPGGEFQLMILTPHKGQWDSLAIFIMSGLWFVGFLRTKQDKGLPYSFMIVFLAILSFLGIHTYENAIFASFLWIVLSTIGITSLNDFSKTERDVAIAEKSKENSAKRKAERERKRAEAAGEKSIRLDEVNNKKKLEEPVFDNKNSGLYGVASNGGSAMKSNSDYNAVNKKSYGVGRRSESSSEQNDVGLSDAKVSEVSESVNNRMPVDNSSEMSVSYVAPAQSHETKNVVKKVERPMLGATGTNYGYNPNVVYTQPSRSRRSLRTPSKSTFTPEDLERISRYSGVSYMASQIVKQQDETDNVETVNEEMTQNIQPENVSGADDASTGAVNYFELPEQESTSTAVKEESFDSEVKPEETVLSQSVVENVEAVDNTIDNAVDNLIDDTFDNGMQDNMTDEEHLAEEQKEESVKEEPPVTLYHPSRRHFRHPSKSTFTPEELERIREFTGVSYQPAVPVVNGEVDKTNVVTDNVKENAPETVVDSAIVAKKPDLEKEKTISSPATSGNAGSDKNNIERKPKMIRNPLPGPKPHVSKELNYDYIPKESEMEFDIVDLKGKDFFDF